MICPEFDQLSPQEKTEYIGKLVHAVQSHSQFFRLGEYLIRDANKIGLFDNVIINPQNKDITTDR